jgi:hypothetical protein
MLAPVATGVTKTGQHLPCSLLQVFVPLRILLRRAQVLWMRAAHLLHCRPARIRSAQALHASCTPAATEHTSMHAEDLTYLPYFIIYQYYFAVLKLYALGTLHVTAWGTRAGVGAPTKRDAIDNLDNVQARACLLCQSTCFCAMIAACLAYPAPWTPQSTCSASDCITHWPT